MITFDYRRAFSRNIGVITEAEQDALRDKHVAIPGCGGVGGLHALVLARAGVGRFTLADFDHFEQENFNRQFGAKWSTIGRPKTEVIRQEILEINPTAEVRVFEQGLDGTNIDDFLKGVDLVIDSLDFFAFSARDLLFPAAQAAGVPLLTAAPLGMSCALLLFTRDGMSYRDYFGFRPEDEFFERAVKFALGLAPAGLHRAYLDGNKVDFKNGRGPSHAVGVTLCGAMAAAVGVQLLVGRGKPRPVPYYRQFDAWLGRLREGRLWLGHRHPKQVLLRWVTRRWLAGRMK